MTNKPYPQVFNIGNCKQTFKKHKLKQETLNKWPCWDIDI